MRAKNTVFYCDACQSVFDIPGSALDAAGAVFSVACPICGRRARVERSPDGLLRVAHKGHVMTCPRPMSNNPLVVVAVYVGAFATLALVFTAVARLVHWGLCPVVLIASLIAIGIIGTTQLAMEGKLDRSYVDAMRIFFTEGLPYLLFRRAPEGKIVTEPT